MSSDNTGCDQERIFYAPEIVYDLEELPLVTNPHYCNDNTYHRYDLDLCPCMSFCCLNTGNQPKVLVLYAYCVGTSPNKAIIPPPIKDVKVVLNNNGGNIFTGSTQVDNNTYYFEVICDKTVFGGTGEYGIYTLKITSIIEGRSKTRISTLINTDFYSSIYMNSGPVDYYNYRLIPAERENLDDSGCGYGAIFVDMGGYTLKDGFNAKIFLKNVEENKGKVICPPCECAEKIKLCPDPGCPELEGNWPCPPPQCPYTFDQLNAILLNYSLQNRYLIAIFPSLVVGGANLPEPCYGFLYYYGSCLNHLAYVIHPPNTFNPPPPPFIVLNISGRIGNGAAYTAVSAPYFVGGCSSSTVSKVKLLPDIQSFGKVTAYIEFDRIACKPGTITPEEYLWLREQYLNESECVMVSNNDRDCLGYNITSSIIDTCMNYWFAAKRPKDLSPCPSPDYSPCSPPTFPLNPLNNDGPCSTGPLEYPQELIMQASVCKDYYKALPFSGYYELYFTSVCDQSRYFRILNNDYTSPILKFPTSNTGYAGPASLHCFWVSRFIYTIYFISKTCLNGPAYTPYNVIFAMRERKTPGPKKYDFWIIFLDFSEQRGFYPTSSLYFPLDENLQYIRNEPPSVNDNIFTPSKIIVSHPCQ
jgi:hypothetical protein